MSTIRYTDPEQVSSDILLDMYTKMVLIRSFEYKLKELFTSGVIIGDLHLSVGQEAVSVGVCANLKMTDYLTSSHRGHGHCLAKGADVNRTMAEFFGKKTGLCMGKGGSMHLADFSVGMIGATPIVGGGIPLAVGGGLSANMKRTQQVSVAFFGDGATNQGTFHESLNLASIWRLPVIFVCENNQYAESTKIEDSSPVRVVDRSSAYAMPGFRIDGMDVLSVYHTARKAIERARSEQGPSLIEAVTYRFEGHEIGDPFNLYQTKEEMEQWRSKDPIQSFESRLTAMGLLNTQSIERIRETIKKRIEDAVVFAKESPEPELEEAFRGVFVAPYY